MVRIVVVSLAALLAAACKPAAHGKVSGRIPAADAPAEPAEPASARATAPASSLVSASGVDVSAPMDLHGSQPAWAVKLRRDAILLERAGQGEVLAANPGGRLEGEQAVWQTSATGAGGDLTISLRAEACVDALSGRSFPYRAVVEFTGQRLTGCGGPLR
jgi:uncharacterized membrane protein